MNELTGYDTRTVLSQTGISVRQLHHWDELGIVSSSIQPAHGSGSRRRYSADDVFLLLVAQALRGEHRSLEAVQRVVSAIRAHGIGPECAEETRLTFSEHAVYHVGEDRQQIGATLRNAPVVSVLNLGGIARRARELLEATEVPAADVVMIGDQTLRIVILPRDGGWEARCRAHRDQVGVGATAEEAVTSLRARLEEKLSGSAPSAARPPAARRAPGGAKASAWGDGW
jgi:DNA-binding transcriptional MerR regulator